MTLPITSSSLMSCGAPVINASPGSSSEPTVCQGSTIGNIGLDEAKALYAFFTTKFLCNDRSYTLRSLFIALDEAKCLGTGSVTIVGSYVPKILGAPFFQSFTKRDVGKTFETTPHDVDFRIALPQAPDLKARDTLKNKIEQTLKQFFGSSLALEPFQNIEDPAGSNHFIIAGIEGSLRVELLWVTCLGRRSLFNEDGLHLEIPRTFWLHESGYVRWNSGEMPIDILVENCIKNELSVSAPNTVDKRGWGRLMVKLAAGKTLQDPSLIETFLLKALLSLQGNKGIGLAKLLTHATRNLPKDQNLKVFEVALQTLKAHLGNPNLIRYTLEDLKTFITCYFPDRLTQNVWLYLLCKDKSIVHDCTELKQNEGLKALIKEKAPELSPLLDAKEGTAQLAALVEFCAFEAAWKIYQTNPSRVPLSKFLLGIIRASLKYPQHLTEGVNFIANVACPRDHKKEALRFLFLNLPMTPFPVPRTLLIEGEAALTDSELISLYDSWIYPILIQEVAKNSSFEEERLHLHLVGPEGERFIPAALKTFKEEVPLEDPLSYAKKHEASPYSVKFLIYFTQLKSTRTALFYLEVFIRHYEALKKEASLLEQAQKRLLDLASYLPCELILEKLQGLEREKISILIQEAPRLKDKIEAQKEAERVLDKPPAPDTPTRKVLQLIDLFCSGYPLSMAIWLRWLTALNQKHFEGKSSRIMAFLNGIPPGSPEQTEKFWTLLFRIGCKLPENPLTVPDLPDRMAAALSAETSSRTLWEALELFLLAHVKKSEDTVYYRPCFAALHDRRRLDDPKWIPLFSRMDVSDIARWSGCFTSAALIAAFLRELVIRKGDQEAIFTLLNKLEGKEKKEAALLIGKEDPTLFAEAILKGYLDDYMEVPAFYPYFEQAAKIHFWKLYQYRGLREFFRNHISLTCKERGFYDIITNDKTAFIVGNQIQDSQSPFMAEANLQRFMEDIEQCSEEFQYRLLTWSLDPNNPIQATDSLSIRMQIFLRFLHVGDASAQKGSHLEYASQFLLDVVNKIGVLNLIEKYLLALLIRSIGITMYNEHAHLITVYRDESMRSATDYKSLDPRQRECGEAGSVSMAACIRSIDPSKRGEFASKQLFIMNLILKQLDAKETLFYNYLDFLATQFYWIALEWEFFPRSERLNFIQCFNDFCVRPLGSRAFYDEHTIRCRRLFHFIDQRDGFSYSHLRKYQETEISRFIHTRGFISLFLGFTLTAESNLKQEGIVIQTFCCDFLKKYQQFLKNRDEEGGEEKSIILSRLMAVLISHPLDIIPDQFRSVREDSVTQLLQFIGKFPETLLEAHFECFHLFTALIPRAPDGLNQYSLESSFLRYFPVWLIERLKDCPDTAKRRPHYLDPLFLSFITYFFMASKVNVDTDEGHWFKQKAIELFDSVLKALKSSESSESSEAYTDQFSGFVFFAAQLIAPSKSKHHVIRNFVGDSGHYFALAIVSTIVESSWNKEKKGKLLSNFFGSLGASGYLNDHGLLDLLSPEAKKLAGFQPNQTHYSVVFNRRWYDLFRG